LLEVAHAQQIRQHSTGVIEAQRLIEIRREQVVCLMRARFHLRSPLSTYRVTTDTHIRYQALTIESVKSHARKLRKSCLLQSGAYLTYLTACMRIVGASHCALMKQRLRAVLQTSSECHETETARGHFATPRSEERIVGKERRPSESEIPSTNDAR